MLKPADENCSCGPYWNGPCHDEEPAFWCLRCGLGPVITETDYCGPCGAQVRRESAAYRAEMASADRWRQASRTVPPTDRA